MENKFVFLFFFIFIFFQSFPSNAKYYSSKDGISIEFPDNWTVETDARGLSILALSQPSGPVDIFRENCNVIYVPLSSSVPLDVYVQENTKVMQKHLIQFNLVEQKNLALESAMAKQIYYQHFMKPMALDVLAAMLVTTDRSYIVTCTATRESFADWKSIFEKILGNIKVISK